MSDHVPRFVVRDKLEALDSELWLVQQLYSSLKALPPQIL